MTQIIQIILVLLIKTIRDHRRTEIIVTNTILIGKRSLIFYQITYLPVLKRSYNSFSPNKYERYILIRNKAKINVALN